MPKNRMIFAVPLAVLSLAGCQQSEQPPEDAATGSAPGIATLPVSINAAMVGMIDQSADYIWAVGNGDLPKDAHDWDQVRGAVYDMIIGGQVSKVAGPGEFDAQWVANADWQRHADELTKIGQDALPLVEAKSEDVAAWRAIGDRLVDNCLACHELFKPEVPSQGILHEATTRESLGQSIFD